MYKIYIPSEIHIKLHKFISSYFSSLTDRFFGSGMEFEDLIVDEYKMRSSDFLREIYYHIDLKLKDEVIYGFSIKAKSIFQVRIFVWNFMIVLNYSEDFDTKIREIHNIEFHKK